MRPLLIVGIDPGTTVGYALLDTEGEIVILDSERNVTMSSLISRASDSGNMLVVGCDKKNPPQHVQRFAVQTGAKLISPPHDLLFQEKKSLVGSREYHNTHEFDALASALFAFTKVANAIRKVDTFIKKQPRSDLRNDVLRKVIQDDISVKVAFEILSEEPIETPIHVTKIKQETNVKSLLLKLEKYRKDHTVLSTELMGARDTIGNLRKKLDKSHSSVKKDALVAQQRQQIASLKQERGKLKEECKAHLDEISKYAGLITSKGIIAKKLPSLSIDAYHKKKNLIKEDDLVYIQNPAVRSDKVLHLLEKLHCVLLSNRQAKDIVLLPKDKVLVETIDFMRIDERWVQKNAKTLGRVEDMISAYKKRHTSLK